MVISQRDSAAAKFPIHTQEDNSRKKTHAPTGTSASPPATSVMSASALNFSQIQPKLNSATVEVCCQARDRMCELPQPHLHRSLLSCILSPGAACASKHRRMLSCARANTLLRHALVLVLAAAFLQGALILLIAAIVRETAPKLVASRLCTIL